MTALAQRLEVANTRINVLEKSLGILLFERRHHGER